MELNLPQSWSTAASMVLPVLRGPTAPANAWQAALDRADAIGTRQALASNLDLVVVLDLPELRLFVNAGHLQTWGVSQEAVVRQSLANLPPTTGLEPWDGFEGVWSLNAGDGYESSRLALPGWLAAFADRVPGRPIAIVPDSRTLLITGTESGEALQVALNEGWNRYHGAGTPISPTPYTVDDQGRLCRWRPELTEPLVHRVQACHRFHAGYEYRQQQAPLARWLAAKGSRDDLAVYSMIKHRAGRVVSFAAWDGKPSLLPKVDLVVIRERPDQPLAEARSLTWDTLAAHGVVGPCEPLLRPERYRVEALPPGHQSWDTVDAHTYQPPA